MCVVCVDQPLTLHVVLSQPGYNFTESDYEWLSFHRIVEAYKFSYAQRMMLGDPAFNKTVDQVSKPMVL